MDKPLNRAGAPGDPRLARTLRVTECFLSVQGESTWAGLPCFFIRLARCNLRCVWCDTTYSFHGGETRSLGALLDETAAQGVPIVEITGGEPLAQPDCNVLAELLLETGCTVLIETSGSLPIGALPAGVIRIMDLKCPDSGETEKMHWPNLDVLVPERDEVKFVIASRGDYEWSRDVVKRYTLDMRCNAILFSPVFGAITAKELAEWIIEDRLPVRFQLQQHKFIWPPDQRGV